MLTVLKRIKDTDVFTIYKKLAYPANMIEIIRKSINKAIPDFNDEDFILDTIRETECKYFFKDLSEVPEKYLRHEGILSPTDDDIYKQENDEWVICTEKLKIAKDMLKSQAHELREEKAKYFEHEGYMQKWEPSDILRIQGALNIMKSEGRDTIAWRTDGTNLDKTLTLTLEQVEGIIPAGIKNEEVAVLAQYDVFEQIEKLETIVEFDIEEQYRQAYERAKTRYDREKKVLESERE